MTAVPKSIDLKPLSTHFHLEIECFQGFWKTYVFYHPFSFLSLNECIGFLIDANKDQWWEVRGGEAIGCARASMWALILQ